MNALDSGFHMPAEWAPQEAIWMSWPVMDPRHWGGSKAELIESRFAVIVTVISRFETARINANPEQVDHVTRCCLKAGADPSKLEVHPHRHDDVWCRDHGPTFIRNQHHGEVAMVNWRFNAWGGKFEPWDQDDTIPRQIAERLELRCFDSPMILEGGAIEVNGIGDLLTTEAVLLNPNRNPDMDRDAIEAELRRMLGVERIHWLKRGVEGDDTDGHIDDLARFTNERTVLAAVEKNRNSPNHAVLYENLCRLQETSTPWDIIEIPMPEACEVPGWRLPVLPASYVNFLIMNGAVLVPTFRQKANDDRALGILRELFSDRDVIGIDCLDLVEEGGTLHCLTQQQPS